MRPNVGTIDRILRAVIGVVLLYLAFGGGFAAFEAGFLKWAAVVVGVVMLVVSVTRVCPIYSIIGVRTCPR